MSESESNHLNVLIVDDEKASRGAIELCVDALGHRTVSVTDADAALRVLGSDVFDLALVDLKLGSRSGLDLISRMLDMCPWLSVAVVTAHGSIDSAVDAMRRGAVDYVEKPVSPPKVEAIARRVSTMRGLQRGIQQLRGDLERVVPPPRLLTNDQKMRRVLAMARRAAESDATILLRGESGTGKGVLARAIHEWSRRSDQPFSVVNTPTLSRELLESELFGHVKGAFTGAVRSRPGRVAATEGGTLLLDEIGAMPIELQPKLLRFLQDHSYERVGADKTLTADVRTILATNRDLETAVENDEFREDLYFRIRVIEIEVPPLRDRGDDIVPLAEGFVSFFGARYGRPAAHLTNAAKVELSERKWPGNIRELQNAIERAVILSRGTRIGAKSLPPTHNGPVTGMRDVAMISLDEAESRHIEAVLEAAGSAKAAAKILGISPTTLWRRRNKYDI